jgi:hypothetical protein
MPILSKKAAEKKGLPVNTRNANTRRKNAENRIENAKREHARSMKRIAQANRNARRNTARNRNERFARAQNM